MTHGVYTFAYIQVKDHEEYMEKYGQHLLPIIEKYDGKFLAATKAAGIVEGEQQGNWAVLTQRL